MTRWFNTPLQLHRRWKQTKDSYKTTSNKRYIGGRYRLLHEIGHGASGSVYLAIDVKTNIRYAIKVLNKSRLERQHRSELIRQSNPAGRRNRPLSTSSSEEELVAAAAAVQSKKRKLNSEPSISELHIEEAEILGRLEQHDNIIKLIDVIHDSDYDEDSIYLVMEIAEKGVVMDIAPNSVAEPYLDDQCKSIFKQLVNAVDYLHEHDIVHKDIKPQNLLLSKDNTVKLIDFGNATQISDATGRHNGGGSPAFMAPELLKRVPRDQDQSSPTCSDIWSMGVTLYCLAYGHLPFEKSNLMDLYGDIQNKTITHLDSTDSDLKDLINRLLEKNPSNRITMKDIKLHPWIQK